ncbi:MAG TPA: glycoside hydrolase family 3 N-terminal domain-containing protein [Candidatus Acidoferrales bacterium]|jgi:beta-glucosidase-like glycosyl hydrolase/CubicO group peptidase (beta-lactamase class C family)|nr:glycoside hydrolase family 3 N-terminal domain-containing protein [Candidatus Acidoferrales bacterium]
MRKLGLSSLALLLLMTTTLVRAQKSSRSKTRPAAPQPAWVEQTLKKMSVREKLGQMLMIYYFGAFTSTESAEYKELLHQVEDNHIGGMIVGSSRGPLGIEKSQVYATAVITNELQRRSKLPLLLGADFESGTGMRLDEGTSFPSAMAVAATGDPKLAYIVGKTIALEARASGVHWIFAPDADVNNNPDNPIINVRSFGENPQSVSEYVTQFIRGVQENGAIATAKHFPGHGNVAVDSHLALATVPGDREELNGTELVPFRAAIAAGVDSIMPGHLAVPAFEPDPNTPATLSHNILTGLLRNEMNFQGLIVTDAMDMGGVTTLYAPGEAAVRSVEAGSDVLLMPPVPDAAMAGLEAAVASGRLSIARIDESVRRILAAKARLGLDKNRFVDVAHLNEKFALPAYEAEAQNIADKGVTLLRDTGKLLPLDSTHPRRVLLVALSADPDPFPGETIEPELRPRVDSLTVLRADTQFKPVSSLSLPKPDAYDLAIAALFVRVADRKGNVGFPDDQRAFLNQLLAQSKPVVVASFGSPYLIERFPSAPTWLAEFSTNDVSQRASVRAMFGQVATNGHIPVTVPGTVDRGAGMALAANSMTLRPAPAEISARLQPTYDLLDRAVTDGAFPGGVLAVGLNDQLAIHPFGHLTRDAKSPAVTPDTIYDVASLTKPIVTTTAIMRLVQGGELSLDAPVVRFVPEWAAAAKSDPDPSWRARVTVKMLLLHDSGLPAHRDFFLQAKSPEAVLARIMAEPLVREPGKEIEYSDLGFILLGQIVERLTGDPLDENAQDIFERLQMKNSLFKPPKNLRSRIAPTEEDTTYRKRLLQGEVHDENAYALGGVAGHAGLFSTAGDIAEFAQMMLNGGIYAHHRILRRSTINQFTAHETIGSSARALGWDVPVQPSSSGQYFSAKSYGHTGFTGTSLWIDPERNLFVILLTNRVNPTRENEKIRKVRPALHDAVFESLGLAKPPVAAR